MLYFALLISAAGAIGGEAGPKPGRTWPQPYAVERNDASGVLTLSTPYYTVEQDLHKGGTVRRIALKHGKATNLLVRPLEMRVRDESGAAFSDGNDSAAAVTHRHGENKEIVTVECALKGADGQDSGFRVRTTIEYRWGYLKIRRELTVPAGARVREICPLSVVVTPSLTDYGYREGTTEEEGAAPFAFGSNRWGKLRPGHEADPAVKTPYVPRSMMLADPGVEGLEWFVGSELSQWELQLSGRRGQGQCVLQRSTEPAGLAIAVSPLWSPEAAASVPEHSVFDFYIAFPILEGHAHRPWLHASFNRNRGNWVSAEQVRQWSDKGVQTVHCHNDGDYFDDGLFWRDGSYPPYPDMDRFDKVLQECRGAEIRTATYFSDHELHPSTEAFQKHGTEWGRMNRKGELRHNFYRPQHEFGAQMCMRSGWLDFLKSSIDRVLKNHPLDGVYYDWNVALLCCNPRHEGKGDGEAAQGHWDMDELLDLMEWTRRRVGPSGLVIIHNTTTPMFATENFADYVVATEWGYGKWTERAPDLANLPLEWSLAGAVPRGVISYGLLAGNAPQYLHRAFALEAFLGGVTPWPAGEGAFALAKFLKPLGDLETYQFADWRNEAVKLSHPRCASAVYSREGEVYLLLANLDDSPHEVTCVLHAEKLPHPLAHPSAATRLATTPAPTGAEQEAAANVDVGQLLGKGVSLTIPGAGAVVIRVR